MSLYPCHEPTCERRDDSSAIATVVMPKPRDFGSFQVRRLLPAPENPSIGPFIFFDFMGPFTLKTGLEMEVRPHPHIGLAALTWLFEGALMHRDSLGSVQIIHPGEVNLMTAGRGIVHSERASQAGLALGQTISGVQFWLALPRADEECVPTFSHHAATDIPVFNSGGVTGRIVIGDFNGVTSPARFPHPLLCLDLKFAPGAELALEDVHPERAIYIVSGAVQCAGERHWAHRLLTLKAGRPVVLHADTASRVLVIAGSPLDGPRHHYWNFVSSRPERIELAKRDWATGRFPPVPGESEFIPLP